MFFLLVLFSLARMLLDQRLCPGVGGVNMGCLCLPYLTCARCRCVKCTADVICDICKDWSVAQWEAFLQKRSYSGRRKSLPSGAVVPPAPLLLLKPGALRFLLLLPPFLQKGGIGQGSRRASPALVLVLSPLPPLAVWWERRGGRGGARGSWIPGTSVIRLLLPSRGFEVAGPSHSQESSVLAHSAPPSVESSASLVRDPQSRSHGVGDSSRGRSRSCSSWSRLSCAGSSRRGRRRARSRSGGSLGRSRESRSRSTARSRSRG